jgi:predicted kinase
VFIGLPGAGKSTFYRTHLATTYALVSKDLLRNHARPARRQARWLAEHLAAGRSVVVDNTHPSIARRAEVLALTQPLGGPALALWFRVELAECQRRNAERVGRARVPDVAFYHWQAQFVPPTLAEGFAAILEVGPATAWPPRLLFAPVPIPATKADPRSA